MFVVGGESLVDLVPMSSAPGAERHALPGGSPMNCAIAIAKLGNKSGFMCPISQDEYGDLLLKPLAGAGVEVLVKERVAAPTTKAIVTFNEKMQASYLFERGSDRAFTRETLLKALPSTLELFQIGGFCPILEEDAVIWDEVVKSAIGRGATISIDINVREKLVADEAGYRKRLSHFLDMAHIIKLSEEDHAWLAPDLSIEDYAQELLARPNSELVVVTLGEGGSVAYSHRGTAKAPIYAPPVFGDTVGAGDSLMAGILTWLYEADVLKAHSLLSLDNEQLEDMLEFGAVVAGINCGRKGCQPPTRAEVEQVMLGL